MSTITFYQAVDMFTPVVRYGTIASYDTTHVTISGSTFTVTYTGTGLASDSYGLTGGTFTGVSSWYNGVQEFTVTGANASAATIQTYIDAANAEGMQSYVFQNGDTYYGSDYADGIRGYGGSDLLFGNGGNDVIHGESGNDTLNGGTGTDTMLGGIGNDIYIVDNALDAVTENAGEGADLVKSSIAYTLTANVEKLTLISAANIGGTGNNLNNVITGNTGVNKLIGAGGADLLNGAGGNDILIGGGGKDKLTGGAGGDSFVFNFALNATTNIDTIKDYAGVDVIKLENSVFTALTTTGVLGAGNFALNAAADADDYLIYNSGTGALYYDADGSGAGAMVQFATVYATGTTPASLTASEFVVI